MERHSQCDDCGKFFADDLLVDPAERMIALLGNALPGDTLTVPTGLCPEDGACCFPVELEREFLNVSLGMRH